jgi:hypothetical protein
MMEYDGQRQVRRTYAAARAPMSMMEYDGQRQVRRGGTLTAAQVHDFVPMGWPSGVHDFSSTRMTRATAADATRSTASDAAVTTGSAGWPPGLYVFEDFGAPTPETAKGVVNGARALIDAVNAAAGGGGEGRVADIPQPLEGRISRAHNLQRERKFVPLRVKDPVDQTERRCEHFAEYGSAAHALSYFRGNENIPAVCEPILAALLKEEAVTSLGDQLHWKLTLNDYKASTEDALAEAGGALFPWHTDLAANGEITAISTLLAPAIMEFAPHADLAANEKPTRIVAKPGTLVLLSGDARWKWVHRAMPHPDAAGKARISLVLGCAASAF